MAPDPILEDIRAYLSERFQVEVAEPLAPDNYHVFTVPFRGSPRDIKFHRDYLLSSDALSHLKTLKLEDSLESGNIEFDPYRPRN
jgi:hypothetical protein